jgi:hypothetical protein
MNEPIKVIPLPTSTPPIIIGSLSVSEVIGVLGLHVVETSGFVEISSLRVESRSMLAIQLIEHELLRTQRGQAPLKNDAISSY